MASPNIGITDNVATEIVGLAFGQPHRTDQEQLALETLCAKLDRRSLDQPRPIGASFGKLNPDRFGDAGGWVTEARDSRCRECRGAPPCRSAR